MKLVNTPGYFRGLLKHNKLPTKLAHTIISAVVANPERLIQGRKRTRLLVKKGAETIVVHCEDIVVIYTQNKIVYMVNRFLKKYILDKPLGELEQELDSTIFFRANRQYIININYVRSFKPFEKVKLVIDITIREIDHLIVISQQTAPAFRKWMLEA